MLECDDRENAPGNRRLVNVDSKLEEHVNQVIRVARIQSREAGENGYDFTYRVYRELGADAPGSGIDVPIAGSVSQLTYIERWFLQNLSSSENEINRITWRQSRVPF